VRFNKWITCPEARPEARFRLFCLPFAGGGASIYRNWSGGLGPDVEVCAIQLPGRENRISDPAISALRPLSETVAHQLALHTSKPYFFYGHSMGGLLAFEILRCFQEQGYALPLTAFIGAHRAPHLPQRRPSFTGMHDSEFIKNISAFGGFEPEILANRELLDFLLPTLRADFEVCDGYQYESSSPLECPLVAFSGINDPEVPPADMDPWSEHSAYALRHVSLSAGHFFLKTHRDELLAHLVHFMSEHGVQHV